MKFRAHCGASLCKNQGHRWVLLMFEAKKGNFLGEIAEELGKLEQDKTYKITIEEVDP
jgi:hypothetical protein